MPVTAVNKKADAVEGRELSEEALDTLCRHLSLKKVQHPDADSWNNVCLTLIHHSETAVSAGRALKYANALFAALEFLKHFDTERAAVHLTAAQRLVERRMK